MNIKNILAVLLALFLVGCGGGSSDNNSNTQVSYEQQQSDSQIAKIYLGDNSIVDVQMDEIDLTTNQSTLTLSQNYVSNINYRTDGIVFTRTFYDYGRSIIRFSQFYDYSDNTYFQQEIGYDLTRNKFVYLNNFASGEMGPVVDLNTFSAKESMNGVWESACIHETETYNGVEIPESNMIARIEVSGTKIKTSFFKNCSTSQLVRIYEGEFDSQVLYDEFSKREVIVVKDPETELKNMPPKRFLISSDGAQMIKFFGVNTYGVYHKVN